MITYRFINGFRHPNLNAAKVAQELQLASIDSVLTAEQVVAFAKDKRRHLNTYFIWDDSVAGHKYRLQQARTLMRSVEMQVHANQEPARMLTLVTVDREQKRTGYMPTQLVVTKPDLLEDALRRLKQEATAALRSLRELEQMATQSKKKPAVQRAKAAMEKTVAMIEKI